MDDEGTGASSESVENDHSSKAGLSGKKWWLSGGGALVVAIIVVIVVLSSGGTSTIKLAPSGHGGKPGGSGNTGNTTATTSGKGKVNSPGGKPNNFNPNLPVPPGDKTISIPQAQAMLSGFQSSGQSSTYAATYNESSAGKTTAFTVAQSPPSSLLSLVDSSQAASGIKMEVIHNASGTYNCFVRTTAGPLPVSGGSLGTNVAAGKGVCMNAPPASSGQSSSNVDLTGQFTGVLSTVLQHMKALVSKDPKITGLVDTSTQSVLGITMQCLDTPVTGMTFCWTPQGALGYVEISPETSGQYGSLKLNITSKSGKSAQATGPVSITLTSYTTNLPANEFSLPGQVVSLPSSATSPTPGG